MFADSIFSDCLISSHYVRFLFLWVFFRTQIRLIFHVLNVAELDQIKCFVVAYNLVLSSRLHQNWSVGVRHRHFLANQQQYDTIDTEWIQLTQECGAIGQ